MTIRVGIVGAGRMARIHGDAVLHTTGVDLVAVSDPSGPALETFAPGQTSLHRTTDWTDLLDRVDALLVCSPSSLHADHVVMALEQGKHVFCEKPLAPEVDDARACVEASLRTGRVLQVGFHKRHDATLRRLRAESAHAKRLNLSLTVRDPAPSPPEYARWPGGIFFDCLIHEFDLARFLLGEEVSVLSAHTNAMFDEVAISAGDADSASVVLRSESGTLVNLSASRINSEGYHQRFELHTMERTWTTSDPRVDSLEMRDSSGTHYSRSLDFFAERYAAAYRTQMASFAAAVAGAQPVSCTGVDGLRATELAHEAASFALAGEDR